VRRHDRARRRVCVGPALREICARRSPRPIPGHNVIYVILGTFILAFGWFGFNPGSSLSGTDHRIAIVAVNTMLASASAVVASCIVLYWKIGNLSRRSCATECSPVSFAITGACAFVTPLAAVIIGAVAGIIVISSVLLFDTRFRIDDPVGAISVHGVCGAWGALSVGLFANGSYGAGWNGVHKLFKDGAVQNLFQRRRRGTIAKYKSLLAAGWHDEGVTGAFGKLSAPLQRLVATRRANYRHADLHHFCRRVRAAVVQSIATRHAVAHERGRRLQGLDIPEMGAEAYPDYQLTDKSSPL